MSLYTQWPQPNLGQMKEACFNPLKTDRKDPILDKNLAQKCI